MEDNVDLVEFYKYIYPIVSGCSGFIRTDGYMTHIPGVVLIMSIDESYLSIIKIPIIFNIRYTCIINDFMKFGAYIKKDADSKYISDNLIRDTYFIGWNVKQDSMIRYYNTYDGIDNKVRCIYTEENCININGWNEAIENRLIGKINVSDGIYNYRVPISKSITPMVKNDTIQLRVYDWIVNPNNIGVKTVRYTVYRKKLKVVVDTFSNIIV